MTTTTFQNGNKEITVTTGSITRWEKDALVRDYIELSFDDKREPINKLYEVIQGTTRDNTIEVNGRLFGYDLNVCCDSKTKRKAAVEAIKTLVAEL